MRDYLSPARAYIGKAREQVMAMTKISLKPRFVAMAASTATVAFFAASVVALRTMTNDSSQQGNAVTTETTVTPGVTSSLTVGDPQPSVDPGTTSTQSSVTQSTSGNSNNTQTSITVNNQPVDVPANGSVHKTITNNGNTTQVDISVNSNGGNTNSSSSSTFLQMNTNTVSQNVSTHSP